MRDAIGGTVTLAIIVVFIVVILSYLAFNVNYTKAYRMKNKIISVYNKYDGECSRSCQKEIKDYARDIGYEPGRMRCEGDYNYVSGDANGYYCVQEIKPSNDSNSVSEYSKKYYRIATQISIDLPIIKNILGYQMFWVFGNTKTFTSS